MGALGLLRLLPLLLMLTSCLPKEQPFSPEVRVAPKSEDLSTLSSDFPRLTAVERESDWGREYRIGEKLARDLDLYRAITAFKRAEVLVEDSDRRHQIQYAILLSYYLGEKYEQVITNFEESELSSVGSTFPAYRNLTLILQDSYRRTGDESRADLILGVIRKHSVEDADEMEIGTALRTGDFAKLRPSSYAGVADLLDTYDARAKSVRRAKHLQALLPGAGYYYVGQKKTAFTSFMINLLFSLATYKAVDKGHVALGVIVGSLEAGWYLGGINGAGLAAKEYNERLYEPLAVRVSRQEHVVPLLSFTHVF